MKKNLQSFKLFGLMILLGLFVSNVLMARTDVSSTYLSNAAVALSDNDTLSALTTDVGALDPVFDRAVMTYVLKVPVGTATVNLTATKEDAAATVTGDGAIALKNDKSIASIVVTAENGDEETYTVYIVPDVGCYTPYYSDRINLISDPEITDAANFGGWGGRSIVYDTAAYCGASHGLQSGGSLDYVLTGTISDNTTYLIKAMIKATSTSAKFGFYGWSEGQGDHIVYPTVTDEWTPIEMVVTTGTLKASHGLFYNSASGSYIDNWEMYEVSNDATLSDLTVSLGTLTPTFSSGVTNYSVTVPASTTSVTVTATANDASSIVSGDGAIALTNGEGTVDIVVTPESGITNTYTITFSSSLSSDASLSAIDIDADHVMSPVFDPATLEYDVLVTAGTDTVLVSATKNHAGAVITAIDDTVDVQSGSATASIVVEAEDGTVQTYSLNISYEDTTCFVPLFSDGRENIVPDPLMNSLDGFAGWGYKSVVFIDSAYCGIGCVMFEGKTNGWPDGAAMDIHNIAWEANSIYRVRFMYKTMDGSLGLLAKQTDPDFSFMLPHTEGEWVEVDTIFKVGNAPGTSFFTINNVDAGATGLTAFIDNFELYRLSNDATLSDLQVSGTTIDGFKPDSLVYSIELPAGSTDVPVVTATVNDDNAVPVIIPADDLNDSTIVVVTAEDDSTKLTYTVKFTIASPTDATLSDLQVDGKTIVGFKPDVMVYVVELEHGTTDVPTVTATPNTSGAVADVTPAASLNDTTFVDVTAADKTTKSRYKVAFTVSAGNNDASLSDLQIDGTTVAGFDAATLTYDVELEPGTTDVPIVTATTTDLNAGADVTPATGLPGSTTVLVTAEDKTTKQTYTVNFTVRITDITDIEDGTIKVYPTISNGIFNVLTDNESSVVKVYDLKGELVIEQQGDTFEQTVHIHQEGLYVVHVECNNVTRTFKLMVK